MPGYPKLRVIQAAAVAAWVALWAPTRAPEARAQDPPYALALLGSGPLVISNDTAVGGLTVGGLSGIVYAGNDTYYAITDTATPARFYTLRFSVSEGGVTPLPGQPVVQAATPLGGFNAGNFDGEGIALRAANTLLIASEVEPSIRAFSLGGVQVGSPLPVPPLFLNTGPTGVTGIRTNLGFESLALAPDGNTLWTANEQALKQDGPTTSGGGVTPVRLLRYAVDGETFAPGPQFVYLAQGGLVDLVALPGGDLLALERSSRIQVFQVSLAGATDVSSIPSLASAAVMPVPVTKTLLFDFATSGFVPDNIEGIGFGPALANGDRTLVVVSDNNFSGGQTTQIAALRLTAVPEPGTGALVLTAVLPLAGVVAWRRSKG